MIWRKNILIYFSRFCNDLIFIIKNTQKVVSLHISHTCVHVSTRHVPICTPRSNYGLAHTHVAWSHRGKGVKEFA